MYVVVVHEIEPRDHYLRELVVLVDDNGILVIDNSDLIAYRRVLDGLKGCRRLKFLE